eukprot:TRINITY_DN4339_c0_g1_i2.p1 TRINITY_DN4339_c0_g1~~TRINITY_DN4339_c0_g1_i2.p1  ORF type:complete len:2592 (-),score=759.08 TRINITY_DN4339_c0_g1_i2:349-7296(-)
MVTSSSSGFGTDTASASSVGTVGASAGTVAVSSFGSGTASAPSSGAGTEGASSIGADTAGESSSSVGTVGSSSAADTEGASSANAGTAGAASSVVSTQGASSNTGTMGASSAAVPEGSSSLGAATGAVPSSATGTEGAAASGIGTFGASLSSVSAASASSSLFAATSVSSVGGGSTQQALSGLASTVAAPSLSASSADAGAGGLTVGGNDFATSATADNTGDGTSYVGPNSSSSMSGASSALTTSGGPVTSSSFISQSGAGTAYASGAGSAATVGGTIGLGTSPSSGRMTSLSSAHLTGVWSDTASSDASLASSSVLTEHVSSLGSSSGTAAGVSSSGGAGTRPPPPTGEPSYVYIVVSWGAASRKRAEANYNVTLEMSPESPSAFTAVYQVAEDAFEYNATGLTSATDYHFRVFTDGPSGRSAYSDVTVLRTLSFGATGPPTLTTLGITQAVTASDGRNNESLVLLPPNAHIEQQPGTSSPLMIAGAPFWWVIVLFAGLCCCAIALFVLLAARRRRRIKSDHPGYIVGFEFHMNLQPRLGIEEFNAAASVIQRAVRLHMFRHRRDRAAAVIQRAFRQHLDRVRPRGGVFKRLVQLMQTRRAEMRHDLQQKVESRMVMERAVDELLSGDTKRTSRTRRGKGRRKSVQHATRVNGARDESQYAQAMTAMQSHQAHDARTAEEIEVAAYLQRQLAVEIADEVEQKQLQEHVFRVACSVVIQQAWRGRKRRTLAAKAGLRLVDGETHAQLFGRVADQLMKVENVGRNPTAATFRRKAAFADDDDDDILGGQTAALAAHDGLHLASVQNETVPQPAPRRASFGDTGHLLPASRRGSTFDTDSAVRNRRSSWAPMPGSRRASLALPPDFRGRRASLVAFEARSRRASVDWAPDGNPMSDSRSRRASVFNATPEQLARFGGSPLSRSPSMNKPAEARRRSMVGSESNAKVMAQLRAMTRVASQAGALSRTEMIAASLLEIGTTVLAQNKLELLEQMGTPEAEQHRRDLLAMQHRRRSLAASASQRAFAPPPEQTVGASPGYTAASRRLSMALTMEPLGAATVLRRTSIAPVPTDVAVPSAASALLQSAAIKDMVTPESLVSVDPVEMLRGVVNVIEADRPKPSSRRGSRMHRSASSFRRQSPELVAQAALVEQSRLHGGAQAQLEDIADDAADLDGQQPRRMLRQSSSLRQRRSASARSVHGATPGDALVSGNDDMALVVDSTGATVAVGTEFGADPQSTRATQSNTAAAQGGFLAQLAGSVLSSFGIGRSASQEAAEAIRQTGPEAASAGSEVNGRPGMYLSSGPAASRGEVSSDRTLAGHRQSSLTGPVRAVSSLEADEASNGETPASTATVDRLGRILRSSSSFERGRAVLSLSAGNLDGDDAERVRRQHQVAIHGAGSGSGIEFGSAPVAHGALSGQATTSNSVHSRAAGYAFEVDEYNSSETVSQPGARVARMINVDGASDDDTRDPLSHREAHDATGTRRAVGFSNFSPAAGTYMETSVKSSLPAKWNAAANLLQPPVAGAVGELRTLPGHGHLAGHSAGHSSAASGYGALGGQSTGPSWLSSAKFGGAAARSGLLVDVQPASNLAPSGQLPHSSNRSLSPMAPAGRTAVLSPHLLSSTMTSETFVSDPDVDGGYDAVPQRASTSAFGGGRQAYAVGHAERLSSQMARGSVATEAFVESDFDEMPQQAAVEQSFVKKSFWPKASTVIRVAGAAEMPTNSVKPGERLTAAVLMARLANRAQAARGAPPLTSVITKQHFTSEDAPEPSRQHQLGSKPTFGFAQQAGVSGAAQLSQLQVANQANLIQPAALKKGFGTPRTPRKTYTKDRQNLMADLKVAQIADIRSQEREIAAIILQRLFRLRKVLRINVKAYREALRDRPMLPAPQLGELQPGSLAPHAAGRKNKTAVLVQDRHLTEHKVETRRFSSGEAPSEATNNVIRLMAEAARNSKFAALRQLRERKAKLEQAWLNENMEKLRSRQVGPSGRFDEEHDVQASSDDSYSSSDDETASTSSDRDELLEENLDYVREPAPALLRSVAKFKDALVRRRSMASGVPPAEKPSDPKMLNVANRLADMVKRSRQTSAGSEVTHAAATLPKLATQQSTAAPAAKSSGSSLWKTTASAFKSGKLRDLARAEEETPAMPALAPKFIIPEPQFGRAAGGSSSPARAPDAAFDSLASQKPTVRRLPPALRATVLSVINNARQNADPLPHGHPQLDPVPAAPARASGAASGKALPLALRAAADRAAARSAAVEDADEPSTRPARNDRSREDQQQPVDPIVGRLRAALRRTQDAAVRSQPELDPSRAGGGSNSRPSL